MFETITLPFWLVLLLGFFAVIAIVDRVAAPGVRWFFRRRLNTAIEEINDRLDLQIRPFKLTRRQTLIDQLMYDPKVIQAIEAEATASGVPRSVVAKKAERYAREIVPTFSPFAYFGIGIRLSRWISQFIYRVRMGFSDDESLKHIDPGAAVVFVMNHRSNMDYVLVTYMASNRATLSYAVGEWARIWGLQNIIRAMGAYFIRRRSRNELYRRVLSRYVLMATQQGVTQAVFPEGGLSRDGLLQAPKLGLISYMVEGFDPNSSRDIVFIPVGINYDRVMEDRILTANLEKEITGREFKVSAGKLLALIAQLFKLRIQGKLYRLGYAAVSFGKPLSLKQYSLEGNFTFADLSDDVRVEKIDALGTELMERVGKIIPVLPVTLVASIFARNPGKAFSELQLKAEVADLISKLADQSIHVHIPRQDRDYAVSAGLRMLTLRNFVQIDPEGLYRQNTEEQVLMNYYANAIVHLMDDQELVSDK